MVIESQNHSYTMCSGCSPVELCCNAQFKIESKFLFKHDPT